MDALTNKYCGVGEHEGRHELHSLQATKNADVAWCPFVYQSVSISSVKCSKTLNSCSALPRNWMLARKEYMENLGAGEAAADTQFWTSWIRSVSEGLMCIHFVMRSRNTWTTPVSAPNI